MSKYRHALPQLDDRFFLTDGGMETTLIYEKGVELPCFATFTLLKSARGVDLLREYYIAYLEVAKAFHAPTILDTATWRASPDWGRQLGYSTEDLAEANRQSVGLLEALQPDYETPERPLVIGACTGPRGDGYIPDAALTEEEAEAYHSEQIGTFAGTAADFITAMTLNSSPEAIGMVRAAKDAGMPVVISFTLETDGKLPTGQALGEAITQVDDATSGYPAYYMINCMHPSHLPEIDPDRDAWVARIRGLRANASRKSHAELEQSTSLDTGNPYELAREYAALKRETLPFLNIFGGCCGTDEHLTRHIAENCLPLFEGR